MVVSRIGKYFGCDAKQIKFYSKARTALYFGLKTLGLKEEDHVLVPDYICNTALAPFHALKIVPVYYPLRDDLSPDWRQLETMINDRVKAFVIVNYFGFPNELAQARVFCQKNRLWFIEDNAHGFLSYNQKKPLGTFGDVSVTALHKMLSIPNGGIVVMNCPEGRILQSAKELKMTYGVKYIVKKVFQSLIKKERNIETAIRRMTPQSYDVAEEYNVEKYFSKMSLMSYLLLPFLNFDLIRRVRRAKYSKWQKFFEVNQLFGVRPLFSELPDGVCPYVFPLYAKNRERTLRDLKDLGVDAYIWPYLPQGSEETRFSQHVLVIFLRKELF